MRAWRYFWTYCEVHSNWSSLLHLSYIIRLHFPKIKKLIYVPQSTQPASRLPLSSFCELRFSKTSKDSSCLKCYVWWSQSKKHHITIRKFECMIWTVSETQIFSTDIWLFLSFASFKNRSRVNLSLIVLDTCNVSDNTLVLLLMDELIVCWPSQVYFFYQLGVLPCYFWQ